MPGRRFMSRADQEFISPALGSDLMLELMERDPALWKRTGDLLVTAFLAGKQAERVSQEESRARSQS